MRTLSSPVSKVIMSPEVETTVPTMPPLVVIIVADGREIAHFGELFLLLDFGADEQKVDKRPREQRS
jgi:hypothetical protein